MNQLIIPIRIEAFLTNGKTSNHKMIPQVSPDYKKVSYNSFLGSKNTPGDFKLTPPLSAGVHLHFILPDALTHSAEDGYPAVPNRFVLTRLYSDSGKKKIYTKCTIIESDFMSTDSRYAESIRIPRFDIKDLKTNWRYLGRSYDADKIPPKRGNEEYLEKLTAVGAGDPMFAAYYPSCASVFGFHDDLKGVPLNSSITYFVMGYHSDAAKDPFSQVKSVEDYQNLLEDMRLSVDENAGICESTVLFGEISKILWKGTNSEYEHTVTGEIDVTIANTSAEALSAAVVRCAGAAPEKERFLTALQYELEESGDLLDGNYKIDDEIHLRQFQRLDSGGQKHELVIPKKQAGEQEEALNVGKSFSEFCAGNDELYRLNRALEYHREKLFYTWEQYMLSYEDPRTTPKNIPSKAEMLKEIVRICKDEIGGLQTKISIQSAEVKERGNKLDKEISGHANVQETAPDPFYLPKDPVLLLSGAGVKRTYAFGEDGRFTNDDTNYCQTDIIKANVAKQDVLRYIDDTTFISDSDAAASSLPYGYENLLYQAILLGSDSLPVIEENIAKVEICGDIPSKVAINTYHSDFITLFMAWEAEYRPTGSNKRPDDTLSTWKYAADEVSYHYEGNLTPSQTVPLLFSGRIILTPHAIINFSDAIKRWLDTHADKPEIAELAKKVKDIGVVSQNLDGFTQAFSSIKQTYQFPIIGAGGDDEVAAQVGAHVSPYRVSIIPEGTVRPLRGGYLGINRLSLVGTFGQMQNFTESTYFGKKEIYFAETMERFDSNYALIPPAFTTPARLNFDFISALDDARLSSSATDSSPIFGIVLPELLNHRLMIYQADGHYIGSVNTALRDGRACARWLSAEKPEQKFEETEISDVRLHDFVDTFLKTDGALGSMLKLIDEYLNIKLIPHANNFIWGRPFVLARCKMAFEFLGGTAFVKQITSFGKYETLDAMKISFPVIFGGMQRTTDGVLGAYSDDYGFDGITPAFGAEIATGGYILPQNEFKISAAEGEKNFTLLMEPHDAATISTGLMPVKTVVINAAHVNAADNLLTVAEINPLITDMNKMQLPLTGYQWRYRQEEVFVQGKTIPPMVDYEENVVMDGFIVKEDNCEGE